MTNFALMIDPTRVDISPRIALASWARRVPLMAFSALLIAGCGGGGGGTTTATGVASTPTPAPAPTPSPTPVPTPTPAPTATLTVSAGVGGTVSSDPSGIASGSGSESSASFTPGTSVTLTAQPASGYAFSQWGGACSGFIASCTVELTGNSSVTASFSPVAPVTGAPYILYTDIVSGPTSGGENDKGAYLSIFGKNFGSTGLGTTTKVKIGGVEVADYRYLGFSKVPGIQQITVQVGALGGAAQGVALPVQVIVGSDVSNTNVTFKPNPGRMLFVDNVAGDDDTAAPGDITKPYRYVQTPALYTGGAWEVVRPGDIIVMRGHGSVNPWTDVGFEHFFMRFRDKSGSAPTGASGTGAIAIVGYPGEDTYIRGTQAQGITGGCISAINGQANPGKGQWAVISNLRIDCEGYDGPISQEVFGHNWRVINNDLSASTAPRGPDPTNPRMAGITGNGDNSVWYGNHIHDIQGRSGECHGIYIDGNGSYDIAYNYIHDIRDGNGFQVYVNGGNGSTLADNISLHHNMIHDVSKHGINIADGARNNVKIWNNIVYNVDFAAIRFNTTNLLGAQIFNNTFYNTNRNGNTAYGALTNDWNLQAGALDIENNIFYVNSGTPYKSGSNANNISGSTATIANNLWFNGSGSTSFDSTAVTSDPLFVTDGSDFHLQAGSPAIGAGSLTSAVTSLVHTDFDVTSRGTTSIDLGALEY